MTLVIAMLTKDYVILATDRRITRIQSGQIISQADSDTKTFLLNQHYLMGFAGLGRVPLREIDTVTGEPKRQRMVMWIADLLTGSDGSDYTERITDAIGRACASVGYTQLHSFLCVGYQEDNGQLKPFATIIDNRARPHAFYPYEQELEDEVTIMHIGATPEPTAYQRLRTVATRHASTYPTRPNIFLKHFDKVFAATAAVTDTVGSSCLLTVLPRKAVPAEGFELILNPSEQDEMSDECYGIYQGDSSTSTIGFAPAMIDPHRMLVGMSAEYLAEGWLPPEEGY